MSKRTTIAIGLLAAAAIVTSILAAYGPWDTIAGISLETIRNALWLLTIGAVIIALVAEYLKARAARTHVGGAPTTLSARMTTLWSGIKTWGAARGLTWPKVYLGIGIVIILAAILLGYHFWPKAPAAETSSKTTTTTYVNVSVEKAVVMINVTGGSFEPGNSSSSGYRVETVNETGTYTDTHIQRTVNWGGCTLNVSQAASGSCSIRVEY